MKKLVVMLMLVCVSGLVSADVLFSDDMETDLSKWDISGPVSLVTSPVSEGNQSLETAAGTSYARTIEVGTADYSQMWAEFDFMCTGDDWSGYFPVPVSRYSHFGVWIRPTTYNASSGNWNMAVSQKDYSLTYYHGDFALNEWHKFLVGIEITNPANGDGVYSLYVDQGGSWAPLVEDFAYESLEDALGTYSLGRIQLRGNNSTHYVDALTVYDANPIPEPMTMVLLGLGGVLLRRRK